MKSFTKNIILSIVAVLFMAMVSSCVYDSYPDYPDSLDSDKYLIVLRINALDGVATTPDLGDRHEMVKSLRIIMLNNGAVELNRYVAINEDTGGISMAELEYVLTTRTIEGNKKFYLFANEESVENLRFMTETTLTEGFPDNLHDYLEGIQPDTDDAAAGQAFEDIVNAIYFQPDYTADESGNLYIPYSSYYEGYEVDVDSANELDNTLQMFLVPVATKFIFQFVNYRINPVEVNDITVSSTNPDNFLLARVNTPDVTKTYEGTNYYWVDWLAKISEASHGSSDFYDNVNFNEKYGWILNYDVPNYTDVQASEFIGVENHKEVPAGEVDVDSEEIIPSTMTLGPFYAPESRNTYTYRDETTDKEITVQRYGLTLGLHDTSTLAGHDPVFNNVVIDNLQALFRNTCVLIKITMSAGEVEVYAEINPWNIKTANGWLVEGNAPSNNPFTN